jgi:hypothetical protein
MAPHDTKAMKPIRKKQSTFDFLRQVKNRAAFFGAPTIERSGNDISVLFRVRGAIQRGTISFPDEKVADSFERRLRDLYPQQA